MNTTEIRLQPLHPAPDVPVKMAAEDSSMAEINIQEIYLESSKTTQTFRMKQTLQDLSVLYKDWISIDKDELLNCHLHCFFHVVACLCTDFEK